MNTKGELAFYLELGLLGAIWGASFLFLRVASPEFGPLALIFIRTFVAAVVLLPIIFYSREHKTLYQHWPTFLWLGAITAAIPFTLFSYAALYITAGKTSILNATTSMFSAIIAWYWLQEKLSVRGIAGLLVGFIGVFVLSSGQNSSVEFQFKPVLATLIATSLYAYGSCFVRKKLAGFWSITVAAGCQIGSALVLLPLGIIYWPTVMPGRISWLSALLLGVFCTALALIMYFRLLKRVGVAKTVSVTYLIPVFGILWGGIFLQEKITVEMLSGGGLVMLGVALTTLKTKGDN